MISSIIPTYRNPDYLDICLKSAIELSLFNRINNSSPESRLISNNDVSSKKNYVNPLMDYVNISYVKEE